MTYMNSGYSYELGYNQLIICYNEEEIIRTDGFDLFEDSNNDDDYIYVLDHIKNYVANKRNEKLKQIGI